LTAPRLELLANARQLARRLASGRGLHFELARELVGDIATVGARAPRVGAQLEPGQWVELKNQTASKIIVRLDRIDGIAAP